MSVIVKVTNNEGQVVGLTLDGANADEQLEYLRTRVRREDLQSVEVLDSADELREAAAPKRSRRNRRTEKDGDPAAGDGAGSTEPGTGDGATGSGSTEA